MQSVNELYPHVEISLSDRARPEVDEEDGDRVGEEERGKEWTGFECVGSKEFSILL